MCCRASARWRPTTERSPASSWPASRPRRAVCRKIQVTFDMDANGILSVEARDLGTGRVQQVRITPASGLSKEDIDHLVAEAEKFRTSDAARKELAEMRNQAETLVYTTEQALEGYADLLRPEVLSEIRASADELKKQLAGMADLGTLRDGYQRLEGAAFKIAESMYGTEEAGGAS